MRCLSTKSIPLQWLILTGRAPRSPYGSVATKARRTACEQDIDYSPYGGQENGYCPPLNTISSPAKNVISDRMFEMHVLSELVDVERGGNKITNWIGYCASRQEYDGILLFGARALDATEFRHLVDTYQNESRGFSIVDLCFNQMRKSDSLSNLVILRRKSAAPNKAISHERFRVATKSLFWQTSRGDLPAHDFR